MLATKLRALLQRDKGRDLFDLAHALQVVDGFDRSRVIDLFARYLALQELRVTRAQAEVLDACTRRVVGWAMASHLCVFR